MDSVRKPFGGALSEALSRAAERKEALNDRNLGAAGAERRRAAKTMRQQQVVDRLLQRLERCHKSTASARAVDALASEPPPKHVCEAEDDKLQEEKQLLPPPPQPSPLETVRTMAFKRCPNRFTRPDVEALHEHNRN